MVIGFRCTPDEICVVVLEGTKKHPKLVAEERMQRPKNLTDPAFFSWVHREITDLFTTMEPQKVVYKRAEHQPYRSGATERRAQVEAIIELAAYDCEFKHVKGLTKAQIASALEFGGNAKDILDALVGTSLDQLKDDPSREAALAALSVL